MLLLLVFLQYTTINCDCLYTNWQNLMLMINIFVRNDCNKLSCSQNSNIALNKIDIISE